MRVSEKQADLMRHALGLSQSKESYRNYFAAEPEGDDTPTWEELVGLGFAVKGRIINRPPNELQLYHVSPAGRAVLKEDE
jgi:hypothetical protein